MGLDLFISLFFVGYDIIVVIMVFFVKYIGENLKVFVELWVSFVLGIGFWKLICFKDVKCVEGNLLLFF